MLHHHSMSPKLIRSQLHTVVEKLIKPQTRQICMRHLGEQLNEIQPSLIFCMGNVSVQSYFNDESADVKSLRGQWHDVRGLPTTVAYHPLAVRRRPNLWNYFLEDFQLVADRLKS